MATSDAGWVDRLLAGSSGATAHPGRDARVSLTVGDGRIVLDIRDGRFVGTAPADAEAEVDVPLTDEQAQALIVGELSLAVAYMRGDVKPVGSTGALAVLIEVVEDATTWADLRA